VSWIRLDDNFFDHPKVIGLSDRAFRVFVKGICYANRHLTDGVISVPAQRYLRSTKAIATELLRAGLWELGDSGSFRIHDFLEYQFSKSAVIAIRQVQRAGGKARASTAQRVGGRFAPAAHQQRPGAVHQQNTSTSPSRTQVSIETGTRGEGYEDPRVLHILKGTKTGRLA